MAIPFQPSLKVSLTVSQSLVLNPHSFSIITQSFSQSLSKIGFESAFLFNHHSKFLSQGLSKFGVESSQHHLKKHKVWCNILRYVKIIPAHKKHAVLWLD